MHARPDYQHTVVGGTIGGHLRAIWGPFGGQSETLEKGIGTLLEANFSPFSGPKWPEIPHIMHVRPDYQHTVLVGVSHFQDWALSHFQDWALSHFQDWALSHFQAWALSHFQDWAL